MREKICDMCTLLKYAAVAYSHKTDISRPIFSLVTIGNMAKPSCTG